MRHHTHNTALQLLDDLIAEGKTHFTFDEVRQRLDRSPSATGNLLQRMLNAGLVDRVRRGHYAIRELGVLSTPAVAEDIALAVGAAFAGIPHRMAYRTALDEHDLITHPARSIQVATPARLRSRELSGMPLRIIREPEHSINVGAIACRSSWVSDVERALLDAAMRPNLVGGSSVLAEAITAAGSKVEAATLADYARRLGWAAALRRIGSVADTFEIEGLAGHLHPLDPITADLDLEPGKNKPRSWRDSRWHVRWQQSPDEIASVVYR
jgi:predicted transcriptional regulator of viral defense system